MSRRLSGVCAAGISPGGLQLTLVFIVVAIEAEQFPVAAIGWVVPMVVVAVMHCEFAQIVAGEFAGAAAADPRVDFQGLLAITLFAGVCLAAGFCDDAVKPV